MKFCKRFFTALLIFALSTIAAVSVAGCGDPEATTVTLMVDNSVYGIVKIRDGSETLPQEPTKDLYTFDGWFEDKELKTEFDFKAYTSNDGRKDVTVYAGFSFSGETYTVTLNGNGGKFGENDTTALSVREREKLGSVTAPAREGYEFYGWSTSKNGLKPWNVNSDPVTSDTTLYAVWLKLLKVTFDPNGGRFSDVSGEKQITILEGDYISEPEVPTNGSLEFAGWATDSDAEEPDLDLESSVYEDLTLYAVWQEKVDEYEVEFFLNYAGANSVKESTERGLIVYEPERDGYVFNGWWNSDGEKDNDGNYILTTRVDLSKRITANGTKVYASWINVKDTCSQLAAPAVTTANGDISWSKVAGATGYKIIIWKGAETDESDAIVNTSLSSYEKEYTLSSSYSQGYYVVKVKAKGDGYTTATSAWSSARTFYFKKLENPAVSFDLTTSVISWDTVKYAYDYKLYINDAQVSISNSTLKYDLSDYDAGVYQVRLTVSASGYADGSTAVSVNKLRLKTPQVTALYNQDSSAYQLRWNAVVHADKYIVTINGEDMSPITATTYNIPKSAWGDKKELTYKVNAFNSNGDYIISLAKTVKLGIPNETTIKLEGTTKVVRVDNGMNKFCTVTLDPNGGRITLSNNSTTAARYSMTVTASYGIDYPDIPTRSGHVFTGWYTDNACKHLFDFSQTFYNDITLYAGWYKMPTDANHLNNKVVYSFFPLKPEGGVGVSSGNISNSGTSEQKCNFQYFCTLSAGEYSINYYNNNSITGTYFYIYNVTQDKVILTNTLVTDTSSKTVSFDAKAGDIIYVRNYRSNQSYSTECRFFVYGGKAPASGGKFTSDYYAVNKSTFVGDGKTFTAGIGTVVELTAATVEDKTFKGWYNSDGTLLSEKLTFKYTVTDGDVTLTAKYE